MLNIVVPMAGHGSRFAKAGYALPKPMIDVCGKPMIQVVVENLTPKRDHRFIFICQRAHVGSHNLDGLLQMAAPGCKIISIDGVTEGAACTVLLAREHIDNADALMIANCDQYVDMSIDDYLRRMDENALDGLIMTMSANDPKWSYVKIDESNAICKVVEKQVVSSEATVGIYNFAKGSDFVASALAMIDRNERVNGEFYVAPAYNGLIAAGSKLGYYNIGADRDGMYGLGIPEDLTYFIGQFNGKERFAH